MIPPRQRPGRVFVPGGRPTVTYVPRSETRLESRLKEYLDERHKVLSVSGPTKTGKTVLLKATIQDAIWISGGSIESSHDYWSAISSELGLSAGKSTENEIADQTSDESRGRASGGMIAGELASGTQSTRRMATTTHTKTAPRDAVRRELRRSPDTVVLVDDFHYVPTDVQLEIARGMKDLVFDGVGFIVAAVPHRAYDVVRVEKEMTGRVTQLEVGFWSESDLEKIAVKGFEALNVTPDQSTIRTLVGQSFKSPHLMQEFCLHLCKSNGISETLDSPSRIDAPDDWDKFFSVLAPQTSKAAFDVLARGPRQRSDRKQRRLKNGGEADIYGAVLRAIAQTGPLTELTYEQLRSALKDVLDEEIPQRHEITRILEEMSKIAQKSIEGEPVVDYDTELAKLYISDPFFAYWLRWGNHDQAA